MCLSMGDCACVHVCADVCVLGLSQENWTHEVFMESICPNAVDYLFSQHAHVEILAPV